MNETVSITIDGWPYTVPAGITILQACRESGIEVPALCYMEGLVADAACSLCVVEVKGARTLTRSCVNLVFEGMAILTRSERVRDARKTNLELILANHPQDCFTCDRNQNCELRTLAFDLGVRETPYAATRRLDRPVDDSSDSIIRDPNKEIRQIHFKNLAVSVSSPQPGFCCIGIKKNSVVFVLIPISVSIA